MGSPASGEEAEEAEQCLASTHGDYFFMGGCESRLNRGEKALVFLESRVGAGQG